MKQELIEALKTAQLKCDAASEARMQFPALDIDGVARQAEKDLRSAWAKRDAIQAQLTALNAQEDEVNLARLRGF